MKLQSSEQIVCRELSIREFDRWNTFVEQSPTGSPYALTAYLDLLGKVVGARPKIIGVFNDSQLQVGVAYLEIPTKLGSLVINRLLLHYNGLIIAPFTDQLSAASSIQLENEISTLLKYLSKQNYLACTLHSRDALADLELMTRSVTKSWTVSKSHTYQANLTKFSINSLSKNVRRLLRKAEAADLRFETSTDVESCFELHRISLDRKVVSPYLPKASFCEFVKRVLELNLGSLCFVRTPSGDKIAMQLVLHSKHPVTHTVIAGSLPEWNRYGANVFLRIKTFEYLSHLGYSHNDLTGAGPDSVARFKQEIGGARVDTWILRQPQTWRAWLLSRLSEIRRKI